MRLIKTDSLEMEEFDAAHLPPFAILSHTWGIEADTEVTYQDMMSPSMEYAKTKPGFSKIKGACSKAAKDEFDYVWVDTCWQVYLVPIDKTNSTELSESINSMYEWYRKSRVCYAYLENVPTAASVLGKGAGRSFDPLGGFSRSRWFTRGWTLQELIAPEVVEFYASDWSEIGTKASLAAELAQITGINSDVLNGADVSSCNIAERVSWAASRQTTKVEDAAYCLLGIFNVHMPLIYGEGVKAFRRLQEAIIRETEDYTILVWGMKMPNSDVPRRRHYEVPDLSLPEAIESVRLSEKRHHGEGRPPVECSPLARNTSDFKIESSQPWKYSDLQQRISNPTVSKHANGLSYSPPAVTSRGVRLWVHVTDCSPTACLAYTNCQIFGKIVCIALTRRPTSDDDVYARISPKNGGYLFLSPDCLPSFTLQRVYLSEAEGMTDLRRISAPLLDSGSIELSVEGLELQCFGGWDSSLDYNISSIHTLDFRTTDIQAARCLYRDGTPAVAIISRDYCDIISCPDSRFVLAQDGLWTETRGWNQDSLRRIKATILKQQRMSRLRRDRASKSFGHFTLHVAYKRMGSRTVIQIRASS
ncbi:hypothetical protein OQA88_809 [Cercophora sp. LCS_1]